ncbi:MAG: dehydrogenase, partial [Cyclobacteriaceae bacterium]|nr:dehydrogenase [Cyclobacteriaceae bacterium]
NRVEEVFQGTKGSVWVDSDNKGEIKLRSGKSIYSHVDNNDTNPYQQEHNELFAAIKAGEYRLNDTENGAKSTMTAILGRMATYSGQVITWDEAMATDLSLVPTLKSFNDQAPVLPDADGNYPVPVPGVTKFV